jgi:HAD superfamily hydrolase (TIGR01509 family)
VTVFFDIGSTLIDGPSVGPARRLTEMLQLGPEAAGELEHILFRSSVESAEQLGERISSRLNVDLEQAIVACANLWDAQTREAYVLPGAREAIASLKAAGIPQAYLSNIWAPFYQCFKREFAEEAATCPQFLSFQTGLLKPDVEFFLHALRVADVRPADAVMVGDTYKNDILPAIELGMRTAWILHRPQKERAALVQVLNGDAPAPDITLSSIGELCADVVRRLDENGNP